ncbi:hypothetical protein [Ancylobacter amanitiformis]|uniref:Uncharacterized protein n=1 Tax=Ancylobacter amanitiformis TaxID=217069 RepID=A0ABU0LXW4_9HYPH|nr:hypothetical protein [Ancylobacter amanitiformis]MDQ0513534.1 hypothetical protein [Ancylobacter amanitiformis]
MIAETFRIAMLNTLRIGPYDTPHRANPPVTEWLIAARGGPDGVYLIISDTPASVGEDTASAPVDLVEQNSIVAVLAKDDGDRPQFMMLRHPPGDFSLPGRFFPADGMATLTQYDGVLRLGAIGRHAHSRGSVNGQVVLHDIPHPAPNTDGAINWHFAAEERPWGTAR